MDPFKLGLRNVLGIILPGTIVVLVGLYGGLCLFGFGASSSLFIWIKEQTLFTLTALFLLSYFVGSLFRLNAADKVDDRSSRILLKRFLKTRAAKGYAEIDSL